jgi:hypothetical protein
MKKFFPLIFIAILVLLMSCFISCSETTKESPAQMPLNPNGDSELALLMRQMATESDSIRAAVLRGDSHPVWTRLQDLHSAAPTDPTVTGPVFEGFANAFITSVKNFENSDSLRLKHFNAVVDGCMQCHQEFCPGPMKRIAKLYVTQ